MKSKETWCSLPIVFLPEVSHGPCLILSAAMCGNVFKEVHPGLESRVLLDVWHAVCHIALAFLSPDHVPNNLGKQRQIISVSHMVGVSYLVRQ